VQFVFQKRMIIVCHRHITGLKPDGEFAIPL
jgi:hypothetical protein